MITAPQTTTISETFNPKLTRIGNLPGSRPGTGQIINLKNNFMKTIEINLYKFEELSEEAQQKAITNNYAINVEFDWWDSVYEDAKIVGLQITGFGLDRDRHATGQFNESATETANLILKNHGEQCETYQTATDFLHDWTELVKKYSDGVQVDKVTEENEYDFDNEADELEQEFLEAILEDFSIMLQNESEYLMSDEAIKETLISNEYDFTEAGEIY